MFYVALGTNVVTPVHARTAQWPVADGVGVDGLRCTVCCSTCQKAMQCTRRAGVIGSLDVIGVCSGYQKTGTTMQMPMQWIMDPHLRWDHFLQV